MLILYKSREIFQGQKHLGAEILCGSIFINMGKKRWVGLFKPFQADFPPYPFPLDLEVG